MNQKRWNEIHRINYLISEMESYYHHASLKLGISDSVSLVLYTIYDTGEDCLLSDIYKTDRHQQADHPLCHPRTGSVGYAVFGATHWTNQKSCADRPG